jgi:hypothetical protein
MRFPPQAVGTASYVGIQSIYGIRFYTEVDINYQRFYVLIELFYPLIRELI